MIGPGPTGRAWVLRALAVLLAVLVALVAARADPAAARPSVKLPLTARLASALAVPHLDHTSSAAFVVDLRTGAVLFGRHPDLALAPASTEKLGVSFALLLALGSSYRLRTTVVGEGALEGSTWRGNLVLRGAGDPTLSTAGLRRLARQLRASGIKRVTGSIVGDESLFDTVRTAPGWKTRFYLEESAPLSALVVNGGVYRGRVSENPALAAASALRTVLQSAGIAVERRSTVGSAGQGTELAATTSPPLVRILRLVNRDSDNLVAELLLKHLGAVVTGRGTTAAGAAAVRQALRDAGVPLDGARIVDGSGLSLLDRVTARMLASILVAAWNDPLLRNHLISTLAVGGLTGTLEHRLTDLPVRGRVFAKTGTTSIASALAGYVGGRYAFAVVHNGPSLSTWYARVAQDRFVTALARS